jgi:hypothetical protein
MADLTTLKAEIFNMLKTETKDLWKKRDDVFLEKIAAQMASEQLKIFEINDPIKQKEHIKNLSYLKAQLSGEIAIQAMNLNEKGKEILQKLISIAIETIISIIKAKM